MSLKRVFKQKVTRSTTNNSDGHILQFIALSGWVVKELGQIDAKPLFQIWTWIGSCSKPFQTRKWGLTVINDSLSPQLFFYRKIDMVTNDSSPNAQVRLGGQKDRFWGWHERLQEFIIQSNVKRHRYITGSDHKNM